MKWSTVTWRLGLLAFSFGALWVGVESGNDFLAILGLIAVFASLE